MCPAFHARQFNQHSSKMTRQFSKSDASTLSNHGVRDSLKQGVSQFSSTLPLLRTFNPSSRLCTAYRRAWNRRLRQGRKLERRPSSRMTSCKLVGNRWRDTTSSPTVHFVDRDGSSDSCAIGRCGSRDGARLESGRSTLSQQGRQRSEYAGVNHRRRSGSHQRRAVSHLGFFAGPRTR